ncbi:MAG: phenylacetate-coenzyme A ligase [Candidatus Binatia bacterium]|nr:MAG: phenylacetate-coenzyme A ligase [Candidatus Binatia bacterium]
MTWPPTGEAFERLRETLVWVYEHSPHYRNLFDRARVDPTKLRDYGEFRERVPRTEKTELVARQRENPPFGDFLAVPPSEIASLHTSPGPIYIPRLAEERGGTPVLKEAIAAMGVRPREIVHVTLSYHIMPGGLRLHRAFEEYGCLVINGGTGASRLQVQVARDYGATVYAGTPSFLAHLGDTAREMGLDPRRDLRYRVGFSTAEALTPKLRRELEEMFGIELFDHCGEAQIGPLAGECRFHDGMHLHARDLFCEFLDPETGEPVGPGGVGELVVTLLGRRALPLVRYAPRDVFRLLPDACRCGNRAPRLRFVGQAGAIRKIKGVLVHPSQVHAALSEFPEVARFQILVDHAPDSRYDRARLRLGLREEPADREGFARRVAERVKATVLIQMDVDLVAETEIPETAVPPRFEGAIVDLRGK